MRPPKRARYQTGSVYERCGSFFVRYYTTAVVNGVAKRAQHSEWLCDKDEKHYSKSCKAVNLEREKGRSFLGINFAQTTKLCPK
jgi:hypothetical protein